MGGQACVLYGAAEFSRDLDLVLLPDPNNLDRLVAALTELEAEVIAVPPLSLAHLTDGLTAGDLASGALAWALRDEEEAERQVDAEYWKPLRAKLEFLRRRSET